MVMLKWSRLGGGALLGATEGKVTMDNLMRPVNVQLLAVTRRTVLSTVLWPPQVMAGCH